MNYGNLMHNTIKSGFVLFLVFVVSKMFVFFCWMCLKCMFVLLVCFCITNCYFKCVYRIRCLFLYIWRYFKDSVLTLFWKMSQNCEQFSYEIFVCVCCDFCDFGVLSGPPPPPATPIPGVNVKVPFQGKTNIEENLFLWFLWKAVSKWY